MGIFSCLTPFLGSSKGQGVVSMTEKGVVKGSDSFKSDRMSEKMSDSESKKGERGGRGGEEDGGAESPDETIMIQEGKDAKGQRRSILRTWASVDQLGYGTIPSPSTIGDVNEILPPATGDTSIDSKATRPSTARLREKPSTPVNGSGSVKTKASFSGKADGKEGREDRSRKSSMHNSPHMKVVGMPTEFQVIDHGQQLSSRVYTSENVKQGKRKSKR